MVCSGLLAGIGQLLCAGIPLDPRRLFEGRDCRVADPAVLSALLLGDTPQGYHAAAFALIVGGIAVSAARSR